MRVVCPNGRPAQRQAWQKQARTGPGAAKKRAAKGAGFMPLATRFAFCCSVFAPPCLVPRAGRRPASGRVRNIKRACGEQPDLRCYATRCSYSILLFPRRRKGNFEQKSPGKPRFPWAFSGAGNGNRTHLHSLEGCYTSRCTMPAFALTV